MKQTQQPPWLVNNIKNNKEAYTDRTKSTERKVLVDITRRERLTERNLHPYS